MLRHAKRNGVRSGDLTPTGEGVRNEMLGSSFNGRFMYYAANKQNKAKIDYFGYDILQNLSETVFVNEKDADLLGPPLPGTEQRRHTASDRKA